MEEQDTENEEETDFDLTTFKEVLENITIGLGEGAEIDSNTLKDFILRVGELVEDYESTSDAYDKLDERVKQLGSRVEGYEASFEEFKQYNKQIRESNQKLVEFNKMLQQQIVNLRANLNQVRAQLQRLQWTFAERGVG